MGQRSNARAPAVFTFKLRFLITFILANRVYNGFGVQLRAERVRCNAWLGGSFSRKGSGEVHHSAMLEALNIMSN